MLLFLSFQGIWVYEVHTHLPYEPDCEELFRLLF